MTLCVAMGDGCRRRDHHPGRIGFSRKATPGSEKRENPIVMPERFQSMAAPALSKRNRFAAADAARMVASAPVPLEAVVAGSKTVRTAEITFTTDHFDSVRGNIGRIAIAHGGYIAGLSLSSANEEARSLDATVRVPAAELDRLLEELRHLGHVDSESQRAADVTMQVVDTDARLANLHETEQRLNAILRERTGRLADVLAVEEQIDLSARPDRNSAGRTEESVESGGARYRAVECRRAL